MNWSWFAFMILASQIAGCLVERYQHRKLVAKLDFYDKRREKQIASIVKLLDDFETRWIGETAEPRKWE